MPLIQIGEKHVISSVGGSLTDPVGFLLAELRRLFPRDWDVAVNEREKWFRRELYDLFPETHLLAIECPVILRADPGYMVTDVDAAVFDTRNGSLGLFQLKWQDPFGSSLRKRESRMKNLIPSANTWVQAATSWISGKSIADFRQQFRLPKTEAVSAYLFVVGRSFVSFSGARDVDRRAAWGMWPQVVELLAEERIVRDPIRGLFDALQGDAAEESARKLVQGLEPEEFKIGQTVIRVEIGDVRAAG